MIRYRFNGQVQPPAPFVFVSVRNEVDGSELQGIPAQVDTAADRTVLPGALVRQLGLAELGVMEIGGLGGVTYTYPTYAVRIGIHDLPQHRIEVVASPEEQWILLGRDVLNGVCLTLDGPRGFLDIG